MFNFSKPELQILDLLAEGMSEHEIADSIGVSLAEYRRVWQDLADKIDWHDPKTEQGMSQALIFERARRAKLLGQLHATEARLHALMDLSPNGILIVDGHTGEIIEANHKAQEIFGYKVDELLGMEVENLISEDKREMHLKQRAGFLRSIRKREIGYHPPIFAVRKDGTLYELVIGLIATSTTDDVMVICTKMSEARARGLVSTQ